MNYSLYNFEMLHDEQLRNSVKESIGKIIDQNSFIEGELNFKFEEKFAQMQNAKHCLLVGNGTDALEISLKAYGVSHGDRVGVPALTFFASAEAIVNIGATPVLIDVQEDAPLICQDSLKRVHEKFNLKAVMPVHLYGLPAPMQGINTYCLDNNIAIIEDGAQASGAIIDSGPVGSNPNSLTTFSFYPTKNISAMGDAGAILFEDDQMVERIKAIRNHGRGLDGVIGRNSRCDHFQAAVLYHKLEKIDEYNLRRKKIAKWYLEALKDLPFELIDSKFLETSSWHLFPLKFESQDMAQNAAQKFQNSGVGNTTTYYAKSMKQEKALSNSEGEWEVAHKWAGNVVCIPMHPFLEERDVMDITQRIKTSF